jgi:hypothetical protein
VCCGLQNCSDVPEAVPGFCTDMRLTASDAVNKAAIIKNEKDAYIVEKEDPLATTLPAKKAKEGVSFIRESLCSPALLE